MPSYPTRNEAVRAEQEALDDVASLHRVRHIVRVFYVFFSLRNSKAGKKLAAEAADLLLLVSERAKQRRDEAGEQI
jgi:hypothetical protein